MKEKWTRSDSWAAASLVVAVAFGIADHSGAILGTLGPAWHIVQPFAVFAVGALVGFAVSNAVNHRKIAVLSKRPTQEQMDAALAAKDAEIAELKQKVEELGKEPENPLGLSPAALRAWDEAPEDVRGAFRKLCGMSAVDKDGAPTTPLVFELWDKSLELVGMSKAEIDLLLEFGFAKRAEGGRMLVKVEDGIIGRREPIPGVVFEGGKVGFRLSDGMVWEEPCPIGRCGGDFYCPMGDGFDVGTVVFSRVGTEVASKVGVRLSGNMREYISACYSNAREDKYSRQAPDLFMRVKKDGSDE